MAIKLFRKFNQINQEYLLSDKHIHTSYVDGKGTIGRIAKHAEAIGLRQIAFTEHIRKDSLYFRSYIKEIEKIRKKTKIEVLLGFEAKINSLEGEIDILPSQRAKAELIIASVHRFSLGKKIFAPNDFKKEQCQAIELELSLAALNKGRFSVLGHPGGMSLYYFAEFPDRFFEEIIIACKKNAIAFELNSKYHSHVLKKLTLLLRKYNPLVSLGSDAHSIEEVKGLAEFLKKVKD